MMLEERAEGRSNISYPQMAAELERHLSFSVKNNTLRKHVASCETELWTRISGRPEPG